MIACLLYFHLVVDWAYQYKNDDNCQAIDRLSIHYAYCSSTRTGSSNPTERISVALPLTMHRLRYPELSQMATRLPGGWEPNVGDMSVIM